MRLIKIICLMLLLGTMLLAQTGQHRKIFAPSVWVADASIANRKSNCTSGIATCTLNLAASPHSNGNNEVVLLSISTTAAGFTISSASVGGTAATLIASAACTTTSNANQSLDCAYVIGPAGTAVSVTLSGAPGAQWALSADGAYKLSGTVTLDQVAATGDASNVTSHTAPTITSATNDVVFQLGRLGTSTTPSGISCSACGNTGLTYSNGQGLFGNLNVSYILNATSTAASPATWTTNSGTKGTLSTISFK